MGADETRKATLRSFSALFWVVIFMEFFERGAYYGLTSVLSVYLGPTDREGGVLGFSEGSIGVLNSVIRPLLYLLPILSGALAERFGYRRVLLFAFPVMSLGYALAGQASSYPLVFAAMLLVALGAGSFKPIPSGSIARLTTEKTSGLGFGIFYWTINLGAFIFPIVLVNQLKHIGWVWVFVLSAVATGLMVVPAFFLYRDPPRPKSTKTLREVLVGAGVVLLDWRFVSMVGIYSVFWILYFQMFDSVLWYMKDFVDMQPVEALVDGALGVFGFDTHFKFDAEHVTGINAGTIILLQILVSRIVATRRALPTMVVGVGIGTAGLLLLALSQHAYALLAGLVVFSIGEMTAHPKYMSYVGLIAPPDKKALYMGYSFLYGVFGSFFGSLIGGFGYQELVRNQRDPRAFWLMFVALGVLTMVGLLLYDRFLAPKHVAPSDAPAA